MKRIAIVHDTILRWGGAEYVLSELHALFPNAPIYTIATHAPLVRSRFSNAHVISSGLQHAPFIRRATKLYAPLMPFAVEGFDLSRFDIVLSSSTFFAKGIITRPGTRHISYCYSPPRQIWDRAHQYGGVFARGMGHLLRLWDSAAGNRPDELLAISHHVEQRIASYYRRSSRVVYPPIPKHSYTQHPAHKSDTIQPKMFYLCVARLYPHKNLEVAIETFSKLGYPLVIIGVGPHASRLQKRKGPHVHFLGFVPDDELGWYYRNARAFVMPQEEDFGLAGVEALQAGTPVIALRAGGACEFVHEGVNGVFFDDPIPECLADAVKHFESKRSSFNTQRIQESVRRFSREAFRQEIQEIVGPLT